MILYILVGKKTSEVVENADESSFGEGQALQEALWDDDSYVRVSAAEALGQVGQIGGQAAVVALLEALRDEDREVRRRAVEALGKINIEPLVKGLLSALANEDSLVRKKAAQVIGYYSDRQAVQELKRLAASDPNPEVQRTAKDALERLDLKMQYLG